MENFDLIKKEAKKANAKLSKLRAKGLSESYSAKILTGKLSNNNLNAITKSGNISVSNLKNYTTTQQKAFLKALQSFNESQTSTVTGINKVKEKTIKSLGISFDVSEKEAESIYNFIGSEEYTSNEIDYIKSEIIIAAEDTKEIGGDTDTFLRNLKKVGVDINISDKDLENDLINIYNKYFKE